MSKRSFISIRKLQKKAPRILFPYELSKSFRLFRYFSRKARGQWRIAFRLTKEVKSLMKDYQLGLL